MIRIIASLLSLITVTILLSGCGTVLRYDNGGHYTIYPGTQTDFQLIDTWSKDSGIFEAEPVFVLLSAVDIPISLITDTGLLPVDIYFIFSRNKKCLQPADEIYNDNAR
ncbi:YceK/YidQ family lipoprotein [Verrucomicrobia bacterium S94]|nr:YceK/YidQ family lipoprotein [Verrucomicrobia bacterium S94]